MLVSISSWSYRAWFDSGACDMFSFLDEVQRLGADGFEIFPRHVCADDPAGCLKKIAAAARQKKLAIASLIAGNDFARPAAAERAQQVAHMQQCIVNAAGAGITRLNTFTGYHTDGQDPWMELCRVIDAYREVMPLAEQHGLLLCIENHSSVCTDADSILHIIKAVGSTHLRTNPDFTNFVPEFSRRSSRALDRIYTETAKFAPLAANAHLKVNEFDAQGNHAHVDVARLVGMLRDVNYDGHIVLEMYGEGDPADVCARGVALLRKVLA